MSSPFYEFTEREFDLKFDPDRPRYSGTAWRAVARSAQAEADGTPTFDLVVADSAGLEADACDFIEMMTQMLLLAGYGDRERAFVCGMAGATGGYTPEVILFYDEQLAEAMGCSERTVQRNRKAYLERAYTSNFAAIEVIEGEFNYQTMKNDPTGYRFLLGKPAVEGIERARGSALYEKNRLQALKEAALEAFQELPETPPIKRRKKRMRPDESKLEALKATVKTFSAQIRDLERKLHGEDAAEELAKFQAKIDAILTEPSFGSVMAEPAAETPGEGYPTAWQGWRQVVGYPPAAIHPAQTSVVVEYIRTTTPPTLTDDSPVPADEPEPSDGIGERETIRLEARNKPPSDPQFPVGTLVYPVTDGGKPLHNKPSPVTEMRQRRVMPNSDGRCPPRATLP